MVVFSTIWKVFQNPRWLAALFPSMVAPYFLGTPKNCGVFFRQAALVSVFEWKDMCLAFRGFLFREIQGQQWISALHLLLGEESEVVTPEGWVLLLLACFFSWRPLLAVVILILWVAE